MSTTYEQYIKNLKKEQQYLNNCLSKIEIGKNYSMGIFKLLWLILKTKSFLRDIRRIDKRYCSQCEKQEINDCSAKKEFVEAIEYHIKLFEELTQSIERVYPFLSKIYKNLISDLKETWVEISLATDEEVLNISNKIYQKLNESF